MPANRPQTPYNIDMTPAELWQAIGRVLERRRLDQKWKPIDVERGGGPSYKTVQAIEAGDIGTVESLDKCARALGLSLVDVLHGVLMSNATALSPEAAQIVRKFAQTTVAGRTALLALAQALPVEAPADAPPPAAAPAPIAPRPPRPGRPPSTRRKPR